MKLLIKLMFSLSSFSGILIFLLVNKNINIPFIDISFLIGNNLYIKYILIFAVAIFFALICVKFSTFFLKNTDTIDVDEIKPVEGVFLPVYIGLFVIALELGGEITIETIFLICFLFVLWFFLEGVSYFNPFFLFFGYKFYEVKNSKKTTFMVITKKKDVKEISKFKHLIRINNFTFLEHDNSK